jgi:alkaline phosphatase D
VGGASASAAAGGAAGVSLPFIAGIAAAVVVTTIALGVGLGLGLSANSSSPASATSSRGWVEVPGTPYTLSPLSPTDNLVAASAVPPGMQGICNVALMSGDASDTTAVLHVTVVNATACGFVTGGSGNGTLTVFLSQRQGVNVTSPTASEVAQSVQRLPLVFRDQAGEDYRSNPGGYAAMVRVLGLLPGKRYDYNVSITPDADGNNNNASPVPVYAGSRVGTFRTFPGPSYTGAIRMLHMSCANANPYPVGAALSTALSRDEYDLAVFNGDTVYADYDNGFGATPPVSLSFYRGLYSRQRNPGYSGAFFPMVLGSASWHIGHDDHEYVNNISGEDEENATQIQQTGSLGFGPAREPGADLLPNATVELLKRIGTQALFERNPITPWALLQADDTPPVPLAKPRTRLFRRYRPSAHVEVFQLDLRQYRKREPATRSPAPILPTGVTASRLASEFPIVAGFLTEPSPALDIAPMMQNRSLLGASQREWLKAGLLASTARWKVIISEYQILKWFLGPHDRWEGYMHEREAILSLIEENNIRDVVFLTGDVHAAIFARVNPGREPPVYEFTTGPVGGSTMAGVVGSFLPIANDLSRFLNKYAADAHIHNDGVRFANVERSNFMSVFADGDSFAVTVRDANGTVLRDRFGRFGHFVLPEDGVSKKGFLGPDAPIVAVGRRRRMAAAAAAGAVRGEVDEKESGEDEGEGYEEPPAPTAEEVAQGLKIVEGLVEGFRNGKMLFKQH